MGLREKFKGLKPKREPVEVPDVGTVWVQVMNGQARDDWEHLLMVQTGPDEKKTQDIRGLRAQLLLRTVCDEDGKLLWGEKDLGEIQALPVETIDLLFEAAQRVNKIQAGDVRQAEKNSAPTPGGGSS